MTYATKQLTHALQELTSRREQSDGQSKQSIPLVIPASQLVFSKEVESHLGQKREYTEKTREVNSGVY